MSKTSLLLALSLLFASQYTDANQRPMLFGPNDHAVKVTPTGDPKVFLVEYPGKQVFHDCNTGLPRMAVQYVQRLDQTSSIRANTLYFESELPPLCQPKSAIRTGTNFNRMQNDSGFFTFNGDRLIPLSATSVVESGMYLPDSIGYKTTNYFPIVNELRRGAWMNYSNFIQCLRGQTDFMLINGFVHRSEPDPFQFDRYGIIPPDAVWSAILLPNGQSLAFVFSNQATERRAMNQDIKRYLISLQTLEETLKFPIPHSSRYNKSFLPADLPIQKGLKSCENV